MFTGSFEKQQQHSRGIMSPKMDYDEWTPLGRGDPLKNDPTFDYSPPMVSKVKYWISPLLRTPDPPIVPMRELTTETSDITETITSSTKALNVKYPASEIKRFYIDMKDPSDMSYVQLMNSKYSNKFVRPQQPVQYQNHYYTPTRPPQPPPPLPMLVPPPPMEPSMYALKRENSSSSSTKMSSILSSLPTTISFMASTTSSTLMKTPSLITKPEISTVKTERPFLKILLNKETSESNQIVTYPTTVKPLTPNPIPFHTKISHSAKPPPYLIIQGHSKVKKYGAIERSENNVVKQETNEITDLAKFELPKDVREGKHISIEDFLPINGVLEDAFKDTFSNQVEGSGFGAEPSKNKFPAYIRPTFPTTQQPTRRNEEVTEEEYYSYI